MFLSKRVGALFCEKGLGHCDVIVAFELRVLLRSQGLELDRLGFEGYDGAFGWPRVHWS